MAYFELHSHACVDAQQLLSEYRQIGLDTSEWEGKANCFVQVRGADPNYGYLLCQSASIYQGAIGGLQISEQSSGFYRYFTNIKVEWAEKIGQAPTPDHSYYLARVVDERYTLAETLVGKQFNYVVGYNYAGSADPTTGQVSIEGKFAYHDDTLKDSGTPSFPQRAPYSWLDIINECWKVPSGIKVTLAAGFAFPTYTPQDLDFRYTTCRNALEQIFQWLNATILVKYDLAGSILFYELSAIADAGNQLDNLLAFVDDALIRNNLWIQHDEPGHAAPNRIRMHFPIPDTENNDVEAYHTIERFPAPSSIPRSKVTLSLRMPLHFAGNSYVPQGMLASDAASDFITRTGAFFRQFPSQEKTYSRILDISPSAYLNQVTWFDLGGGGHTHVESIKHRDWVVVPHDLPVDRITVAIGTVLETCQPNDPYIHLGQVKDIITGRIRPGITDLYAKNRYKEKHERNSILRIMQRTDGNYWEPDRKGIPGEGVNLVYFDLKEDKHIIDSYCLAEVSIEGQGLQEVWVLDDLNMYQGYGPYTDSRETRVDPYRGLAFKVVDDFIDGLPGYQIINMEGVARWIDGRLLENFNPQSSTFAKVEVAFDYWGNPTNGRKPKTKILLVLPDDTSNSLPPGQYEYVEAVNSGKLAPNPLSKGTVVRILWEEYIEQYLIDFVPSTGGTPANIAHGTLMSDLTTEMPQVLVRITNVPDGSQVPIDLEVQATNPVDGLVPSRREHVGNNRGNCTIFQLTNGIWVLDTVQPPTRRPVKP